MFSDRVKKQKRIFLLGLITLLILSLLAGCSLLKGKEEKKDEAEVETEDSGKNIEFPEADPSGTNEAEEKTGEEEETFSDPEMNETKEVMLYYIDGDQMLKAEKREIPKVEGIAKKTVEELLKGPQSGLKTTIPAGTKLRDINIKDKTATVDLSKEFLDFENSMDAEMGIYTIVNTLTEYPTIDSVKIWVEGQSVSDILGVDLSKPLYRDESILP